MRRAFLAFFWGAVQGDLKSARFLIDLFESRGLSGPAKGSKEDVAENYAEVRESLRRKLHAAVAADERKADDGG